MKFAIALLVTSIAATSAFAGSRMCLDAKLISNSHVSIACPAATEICVRNLVTTDGKESAKSLVLMNGSKKTLEVPFNSYGKTDDADVQSRLLYTFIGKEISAYYEVESDREYARPTKTGTFNNLTVFTGKKSNDNTAMYSQACDYVVVK